MNRRSDFLTFLSAIVPGAGYIYFGFTAIGLQVLLIFFLISPIFKTLGIKPIGESLRIIMWIYTFYDTYKIAHKLDRGQVVTDEDIAFSKYLIKSKKVSQGVYGAPSSGIENKKALTILAWVLMIIGVLAFVDKIFGDTYILYNIKYYIKYYVGNYGLPVLLMLIGIYILYKTKK